MVNILPILSAAKSAISIYASAIALGSNSSIPLSQVAIAMADVYLPNFTSFTLGTVTTLATNQVARAGIEAALTRYNQSGLGTDIRLDHSKVDVVSAQSAICWITWKIFPAKGAKGDGKKGIGGLKPWTFTDVYGFRLVGNRTRALKGGWEWSNADDEYLQLAEKYPPYFG